MSRSGRCTVTDCTATTTAGDKWWLVRSVGGVTAAAGFRLYGRRDTPALWGAATRGMRGTPSGRRWGLFTRRWTGMFGSVGSLQLLYRGYLRGQGLYLRDCWCWGFSGREFLFKNDLQCEKRSKDESEI